MTHRGITKFEHMYKRYRTGVWECTFVGKNGASVRLFPVKIRVILPVKIRAYWCMYIFGNIANRKLAFSRVYPRSLP